MFQRILQFGRSGLLAVAVAAGQACGGSGPDAQVPAVPAESAGTAGRDEPTGGAKAGAVGAGASPNLPKMNPAARAAYSTGTQAFRSGDLDGAAAGFLKATAADPAASQAYFSLGVVRERQGDSAGAFSAYSKAISLAAGFEPAAVAYAVLMARQGNADAAEEYLNGRLAKLGRSAAMTTALAEVKSIRGDSGAAQRLAKEALKIDPDYRPAMIVLARDHYRSRRLDLALYSLQGILDGYGPENPPRDRDNPEALLIRGLIYRERGQRAAAIADFKRCLEVRPDVVEAKVQLAGYLLESGNATEAVPLLESALRYDRDSLLARMNLGDGYRLLGRAAEAKQQLEWVQAKDPRLPQVHYAIGLLYLFSDSIPGVTPKQAAERAMVAFEEYKRLKPRSGHGQADDVDELYTAAKSKKAVIEASEAEAVPGGAGANDGAKSTGGNRAADGAGASGGELEVQQ